MNANFVELGNVAQFINGAAFKPEDWCEDGLKIIRIQNLTDETKPFNCTKRVVDKKLIVEKGDILVSWSATLGVFEWKRDESALLNQHIFRVIPNINLIDKNYLRNVLSSALNDMNKHLHGATMKHVNRGEFLATKIPLPPLAEQKRIAAILDKANDIKAKRELALAKLDELEKSTFIEMFGDFHFNPKQWENSNLGNLIHSASDGPHVSPKYSEFGIPFLSTRHIRAGEIIWKDLKYLEEKDALAQWKKCKPERGDILYSKGGTTGLAAVVDVDFPFAIWVHIALLKPKSNLVLSEWLASALNTDYCYKQSQELTHGIANKDLGLKRMVNIKLLKPPIKEQSVFVNFLHKIQKQKEKLKRQLSQHSELITSLQNQAFTTGFNA